MSRTGTVRKPKPTTNVTRVSHMVSVLSVFGSTAKNSFDLVFLCCASLTA